MWKEVKIEAPNVLGLECAGTLAAADFEAMHAWLDRELAGGGKPALVILMGAFEGYADPAAMWADLEVDTRHMGDFSRIAMVADQGWIEWATKVADPVTRTDFQWFEPGARDAAVAWAADGAAGGRGGAS